MFEISNPPFYQNAMFLSKNVNFKFGIQKILFMYFGKEWKFATSNVGNLHPRIC